MASVSTTTKLQIEFQTTTITASVPYTGTAAVMVEFKADNINANSGVIATGFLLMEFENFTSNMGGVAGYFKAAAIELTADAIRAQSGVTATCSALMSFHAATIKAFDGATCSVLMEFDRTGITAHGGTSGTGAMLCEFTGQSIIANTPVSFTTNLMMEFLVSPWMALSDVPQPLANPAEISTLELPIVAFAMNVLTKGVTAYTENVNGQVRALVATPVMNFNSPNRKYVPDLYSHMRTSGDVAVSVIAGETTIMQEVSSFFYDEDPGLKERRAKLPKGISSTNWQFFLENQDGADMQIVSIEPAPVKSSRIS